MPPAPAHRGWRARLELAFEQRGGRTVLARRRHEGPLVVQRPFYPDGDDACHVYLVHPPGGIVGSDELTLDIDVGGTASALLTTPAATKLYRAARTTAIIDQRIRVGGGAHLAWLPQETIAFRGARAAVSTRVDLAGDATCFAWEIVCLGRTASGEIFDRGQLRQRFEVWRDGAPVTVERARYTPALAAAGHGLAGAPVTATAVFAHPQAPALVAHAREALTPAVGDLASTTTVRGAAIGRYLGARVEDAHRWVRALWALAGDVAGRPCIPPRIWAT